MRIVRLKYSRGVALLSSVSLAILFTNLLAAAVATNGTVVGWGYDPTGALAVPSGLSNVVAIASGDGNYLAVTSDGSVVAWGYNRYGENNVLPSLSNVVSVAAGYGFNLALKGDGTVV